MCLVFPQHGKRVLAPLSSLLPLGLRQAHRVFTLTSFPLLGDVTSRRRAFRAHSSRMVDPVCATPLFNSGSTRLGQNARRHCCRKVVICSENGTSSIAIRARRMLAMLSARATVPSAPVVAAIEIVCRSEAQPPLPSEARRNEAEVPVRQSALTFASRTRPEPAAAVLFQRPPPLPSLFS